MGRARGLYPHPDISFQPKVVVGAKLGIVLVGAYVVGAMEVLLPRPLNRVTKVPKTPLPDNMPLPERKPLSKDKP
jgi:hypothetical protein